MNKVNKVNKRDTDSATAVAKQKQEPGKRGKKPDGEKIKSKLAESLPGRVSEAKLHALKTAAKFIARAQIKTEGRKK